ncbi:metal-sensitive transcriptional regulator [Patescibacteria group bacterium]|nr:metal-sensitive transcriptional regulator [Patescibacteria group bacterium]
MPPLTTNKTKSQKLGRQAMGTLAKVNQMIEDDAYCPDVIQQVDAAIGLLRRAKRELLAGHLDHCLEHKLKENKQKAVQELLKLYNLSS